MSFFVVGEAVTFPTEQSQFDKTTLVKQGHHLIVFNLGLLGLQKQAPYICRLSSLFGGLPLPSLRGDVVYGWSFTRMIFICANIFIQFIFLVIKAAFIDPFSKKRMSLKSTFPLINISSNWFSYDSLYNYFCLQEWTKPT